MRESEIVVVPHSRSTSRLTTASMRLVADSGRHSTLIALTPAALPISAAAFSHSST